MQRYDSTAGGGPRPAARRSPRPAAARAALLAVALALAVAALAALTSAAHATPDAAAIDAFLAAQGSPMTGTGAAFVREGRAHGVDPAFLVAIAGAETSFGRFLYSSGGDWCEFNAFNWFYGPTRAASDFSSWDEAIARVAAGLAGPLYHGAGLTSVADIAPRYCPEGTGAWVANVTAFMLLLGGDPADTRLAEGAGGIAGAAAAPARLTVAGGLQPPAGRRDPVVGSRVTVRYTLGAVDGPLTLREVRLAVVAPDGERRDLVSDGAVVLAPGREVVVRAPLALDVIGRWSGWLEVRTDEGLARLARGAGFVLTARLPRRLEARRWRAPGGDELVRAPGTASR